MGRSRGNVWLAAVVGVAVVAAIAVVSCQPYGRVTTTSAPPAAGAPTPISEPPPAPALRPIPRYGGTVITADGMPKERRHAYLWAKNLGTLVSYEMFLRRYSDGGDADEFRHFIRMKFVPAEREWQEAWQTYSRMEIIDGAICDPQEGLILVGRPGTGRLPPFFYEDLVAALRAILAGEKIGVTMMRIFPARFRQPDDPRKYPHKEFETSVDFLGGKQLWNTHLACILFEGDRTLKSLSTGYDIFLDEDIRSTVPGFATVIEMAAARPPGEVLSSGKGYGRVWIELTNVRINTTEAKNVAFFSDVKMEVRAESKHAPPMKFAKHIQDNYPQYAAEFVIFGEVERAARVVAIAQWLVETYPDVASRLASDSYTPVRINTPQAIRAKYTTTHKIGRWETGLTGGVYFPRANKYNLAPETKVSDTELARVPQAVRDARPSPKTLAWTVPLGKRPQDSYIAWNVVLPGRSEPARTGAADPTREERPCRDTLALSHAR